MCVVVSNGMVWNGVWQIIMYSYTEAGDAVFDGLLVAKVLGPAANDSLWVWERENGNKNMIFFIYCANKLVCFDCLICLFIILLGQTFPDFFLNYKYYLGALGISEFFHTQFTYSLSF